MNKYETLEIFDYSVFISNLDEVTLNQGCFINTLNQYSYIIAERDKAFKNALLASDILLPDGIGIVAAAKLLKDKTIKKIAGADVHVHLLRKLNETGGKCFYLGSTAETLAGIKNRLALEFPNVQVDTYAPPFKSKFTDAENAAIVSRINTFKPDVLFVGMTAPKQEKWSHDNKDQLDVNVICSIGAVFDFYSGMIKRPSRFWINMGLEWLIRLIREPHHLWRRYLLYGPVFVYLVFKQKFILLLSGNKIK